MRRHSKPAHESPTVPSESRRTRGGDDEPSGRDLSDRAGSAMALVVRYYFGSLGTTAALDSAIFISRKSRATTTNV